MSPLQKAKVSQGGPRTSIYKYRCKVKVLGNWYATNNGTLCHALLEENKNGLTHKDQCSGSFGEDACHNPSTGEAETAIQGSVASLGCLGTSCFKNRTTS